MGLLNKKKIACSIIKHSNTFFSFFKTKRLNNDDNFNQIPISIINKFNQSRFLGPQKYLCYAPFKMMYFAFNGEVIACCHNRKNIMGHYPTQNIKEIWNGFEFNKLREYIKHDDLSYGCDVCKYALLSENFDGAKNGFYDRYKVRPYPQIMEFELDNRCNLECIICNDLFSSGIAENKHVHKSKSPYNEKFVEELIPFIPHLKEAKFYGGEPFLIPIYYSIWEKMLILNPKIHIVIQTNGTVLNDKIKKMLDKGNFNINISIDSLRKENFEKIRKNAIFEQTMENVDFFKHYCQLKGTNLGIIPTPNRLNWMDLAALTNWASSIGAKTYFNTLITPLKLALWNLPSTDLQEIIDTLSKAEIKSNKQLEKENAHHFADFIKQLKAWQSKNHDLNTNELKTKIDENEVFELKTSFLEKLKNELNAINQSELWAFFFSVFKEFEHDKNHDLFFIAIQKTSMEIVIEELSKNDFDDLKRIIGKKIYEAGNEFYILKSK